MVPLPVENPFIGQSSSVCDAYDAALAFEKGVEMWGHNKKPNGLVYARLLGQLLIQAPTEQGRAHVAAEIAACAGDLDRLYALADSWNSRFIRICAVSCLSAP